MRFYDDYPRIDFETELNDIPDRTVVPGRVSAEARRSSKSAAAFPTASRTEPGRGRTPSCTAGPRGSFPRCAGRTTRLAGGGGVALLDRGLSGREVTGKTPVIFLLNATDKYYGYRQLLAERQGEAPARVRAGRPRHGLGARRAFRNWPGNSAVRRSWSPTAGKPLPESFVRTSDNVIVEAIRREGSDIELRMAECLGIAGHAEVKLTLPHMQAALTDLAGAQSGPADARLHLPFPRPSAADRHHAFPHRQSRFDDRAPDRLESARSRIEARRTEHPHRQEGPSPPRRRAGAISNRRSFMQKTDFFEGIKQTSLIAGPYNVPIPLFYRDLAYLGVYLLAPLTKVRSILPSKRMHPFRLTPWHCIVTITVSEFRDTDVGPYNTVSLGVPFVLDRISPVLTGILRTPPEAPMIYVLHLPVSSEIARTTGVEIANFPEFLADIRIESDDQWIHCQVDADGKNILSLSGRKINPKPYRRQRVYPITLQQNHLLRSELNYSEGGLGRSKKKSDVRLKFGNHPIGLKMKELNMGRVLEYQYYPAGKATLSMVSESYDI